MSSRKICKGTCTRSGIGCREDLINMLDGLGNGYRRGHHPDEKTATNVAHLLRRVADELEL